MFSENLEIKKRELRVLFQGRFLCETSFIPTTFNEISPIFIKIMQFQMENSSPDKQKEGTFPRWKNGEFCEIFTPAFCCYINYVTWQQVVKTCSSLGPKYSHLTRSTKGGIVCESNWNRLKSEQCLSFYKFYSNQKWRF